MAKPGPVRIGSGQQKIEAIVLVGDVTAVTHRRM
jgi:hypothetical protein